MQTRIRQIRKTRGLTLQQLAKKAGTTPQTVQRLETGNMTVSTDWLERLAGALGVNPADLIEGGVQSGIPLIGGIGQDGALNLAGNHLANGETLNLSAPAIDPVAVSLKQAIGPYPKDCIIIGERFYGRNMSNTLGCDGLACLKPDMLLLRRIIKGSGDTFTLAPFSSGGTVLYDQKLEWAARIVMKIEYY